jgi:hypothetical protein
MDESFPSIHNSLHDADTTVVRARIPATRLAAPLRRLVHVKGDAARGEQRAFNGLSFIIHERP